MKRFLYSLFLGSSLLLTGCYSSSPYAVNPSEGSTATGVVYNSEDPSQINNYISVDDENKTTVLDQKVIIYNAHMDMIVKEPDSLNKTLMEIAEKYEGYAQTLAPYRSTIRVKSAHLEKALDEIATHGKAKDRSISSQDVTEEYRDVEIRLENAMKSRDRYLELLAKAENVETTLLVEKELERLNGEIESMKGRLKRLKHLSDYSTITIYITKKVKPGILGYVGIGLWKSVSWLFVRG